MRKASRFQDRLGLRYYLATSALLLSISTALAARRLVARRAIEHTKRENDELRRATTELRTRNAQLTALSNVFAEITDSLSLEHVVNATLSETLKIMNADVAVVRSLEGLELVAVGAMTRSGRKIDHLFPVRIGEGNTGVAVAQRRTLRFDKDAEKSMSTRHLGDRGPSPSQQTGMPRLESGIIAPLIVGSKVIGTLACWAHSACAFNSDDERMLELLASQVSTAMVAASTLESTDYVAHHDALTGLPNRLQIDEDLKSNLLQLGSERPTAVAAMVDIDRFKHFNDDFGHRVGDRVLQAVAETLRQFVREKDKVYRYGGDEFLLLFLHTGSAEAKDFAERVRRAIEQIDQTSEEMRSVGPITVSVGLARIPDHASNLSTLIDLADKAMYQAKTRGRNRVVMRRASRRSAAA